MATIFDKFGGIRPMAAHLNEAPSSVNGWKREGRIPATKQPFVLEKAAALGLDVTAEDVVFPLGRNAGGGADEADRVALCTRCGERAEAPTVASCTSAHCPLRVKEAA